MQKSFKIAGVRGRASATTYLLFLVFSSFLSPECIASGITVEPGASFNVGDGTLVMNCLDLEVFGHLSAVDGSLESTRDISILGSGSFTAGNSNVQLSGDWSNSGVFNPGLSSVQIDDGCARLISVIGGSSTFSSFEVTTSAGKTLQPAAGSTQVFQDNLILRGQPGSNLRIRSSSPGDWAFFFLESGATQFIQRVDAQDNNASGGQVLAPGAASTSFSVNLGNLVNWFDLLVVDNDIFSDGFESPN